jgi:hypothetical protein
MLRHVLQLTQHRRPWHADYLANLLGCEILTTQRRRSRIPAILPRSARCLGGHVTSMFANYATVIEHLNTGKLRALATGSRTQCGYETVCQYWIATEGRVQEPSIS